MAILSDPQVRAGLLKKINRWKHVLSFLGFVSGVIWMIVAAGKEYNAGVYFSENALLPGLVATEFSEELRAAKHYSKLTSECHSNSSSSRLELIKRIMRSTGLSVYEQQFSVPAKGVAGTNVYGIVRAVRTSGVESIIINVPLTDGCGSNGAMSVALALAKHLRRQSYLAKDIVFLVTQHGIDGMKAWLDAYHGVVANTGILAEPIPKHCGSIQAALVIEFDSDRVTHFDIAINGHNGLLPNLDLINLVFLILRSEGVPGKLATQDMFYGYMDSIEDHAYSAKVLLRMMLHQASGHGTGNHGVFFKYRIEAVTLRGGIVHGRSDIHFQEIGRVLEGVLRSCNNLLERFHQSFFLYLLPASNRYVSVGMYVPAFGLLLAGTLFHAVCLWAGAFGDSNDISMDDQCSASKRSAATSSKGDIATIRTPSLRLTPIAFALVACHIYGIAVFLVVRVVVSRRDWLASQSDHVVFFVCLAVVFTTVPRLLRVLVLGDMSDARLWMALKCTALAYFSLILVSLSLLNISLCFLLAVAYLPSFLCVERSTSRVRSSLQSLLLLLSSPCVVFGVVCIVQHCINGGQLPVDWDSLCGVFTTMMTYLRIGFLDDALGVWTVRVCLLCVLPAWTVLFSVSA